MVQENVSDLLHALDLTGVFANALLGDLIRDVLLQRGPPVALTDYA